ncbi:hypothetical protein V8J88_03755 [Massilia sp. W12]|uniref:hypothetical protein n=1 Tax=Massilia sp. W12 TaxID=3126507 RepID=UPI0030D4EDB5
MFFIQLEHIPSKPTFGFPASNRSIKHGTTVFNNCTSYKTTGSILISATALVNQYTIKASTQHQAGMNKSLAQREAKPAIARNFSSPVN